MPRGRQRRAVPDRRVTFRCEPEHHEFLISLGGKEGVSKAIRELVEDHPHFSDFAAAFAAEAKNNEAATTPNQ